ncbi:class I SAM-dependent methyltransferase [Persicobacter psychrovividus]|uniref:Methyltransferase n=1 Tax=Persicobacter psychrovividus TaxID=387638 RepID=A0ABM7VFC3_9BACT|nr:methyltransferase [Persicobacter psychrovividus]
MKDFWNERYRQAAYAYGTSPNVFLKSALAEIQGDTLLLPAEGEGRNAVHAALQGWQVRAFDWSSAAKDKAEQLAQRHGVQLHYEVGDLSALNFHGQQFDALGLIYAHFSADQRQEYFRSLGQLVRLGGQLIFEGFSSNHLQYQEMNPKVGGPKDPSMLFSVEEMRADFPAFDFSLLEEVTVDLQEGAGHIGRGSVIRGIAKRIR